MVCCLASLTAIISVTLRNSIDASSVALGLSYCINITNVFQWGVRQSAETEIFMTSAERIDEYSHIPSESNFYQGESKPPVNWPTEGKIQFENYKLSYRSELEPVLKGINLIIAPRNKIGIIGRTGAGKSSIFQALFRLTDKSTTDGQILIDGIDINTISLNDLRSILNIIPQSPVLFSNTLRYNLDPLEHHTDEQLWNALEAVQLKTKIEKLKNKLNIQVAEYGSNFSVGECQLICVARAILKQSKILLIDEATAHVDTKTDEFIQQILREKFMDQTIITIAHRLNTVMDSDQIVIMNDGIIAEYGTATELLTKHNELLADVNNDNELLSISKKNAVGC
jgi:ABC-type multidrug transport system fused ATPase/permease subunit